MLTNLINFFRKNIINHYSLPKACWGIIGLNFLNSATTSLYYFLPLFFVHELHLDIKISGLIISFYGLGSIIGSFFSGKISDKISPILINYISMMIQGVCFLFLPFTDSLPYLIINLFILGSATYSFITSNTIASLLFCKQRNEKLKAITINDTLSNLSMGTFALLIGILSASHLRQLLIIVGVILIFTSIFLSYTSKITHIQKKDEPVADQPLEQTVKAIKYPLITFTFLCLFISGYIVSQFTSTFPIYMSYLFPKMNLQSFSLAFSLNTFLVVLLQTPITNYLNRYNHIITISIGTFLLGLGMFGLTFVSSFNQALGACALYTLGEIIFFSMSQLICYEYAPARKKGYFLGLYRMIYAASRVIGPATGSYLYQQYSSGIVWYTCGIIGCLPLLILTLLLLTIKRPNTDTSSNKSSILSKL
ncbi:MAG: MFS transporter [Gammaproteobacteria bacterium]